MIRIRLSLLIVVLMASAGTAMAREVRLSGPGGESCTDSVKGDKDAAEPAKRKSAPVRETRIKPSVHSDAGAVGRLQSPRWHSFLPGMFR